MMQEAETATSAVTATCNEIGFANRAILIEDFRIDYVLLLFRLRWILPLIVTNYENRACKDSV
jgi:hypothetical protein